MGVVLWEGGEWCFYVTLQVWQSKLAEMEEKLKSESGRVEGVKKESGEQLRSMKGEIKSLTDKADRWVC